MDGIRFVSVDESYYKRNLKRETQAAILSKAKDDYQKRKEKEGKKVENWMLPSVSSRLDRHHDDPQDRDISKNDKYKREMKTPKKKKNKNKKYKEKPSESSQSDSDSSKVDDSEWIEKDCSSASQDKKLERDSWMTLADAFAPTLSKTEMRRRDQCLKPGDDDTNKKLALDKPGQHKRELNPYWKDGGSGLPAKLSDPNYSSSASDRKSVGDGGLKWLLQAYRRVVEQAEDENRPMEEVAAERWGSLENLKKLIDEASQKSSSHWQVPGHSRHNEPKASHDNDETRRPWAHSRENTRNHEPSYHSTSYTSTKDIHAKELRPLKMYAFQEKQSSRKPTNAKFKAPVDDDLDEGTRLPKYSTSVNKHPRWKREEYRDKTIPVDSSPFQKTRTSGETTTVTSDVPPSSEQGITTDNNEPDRETSSVIPHLSEKELNDLGAKILKAEIIGNLELASKLKSKLEAAKAAKMSAGEHSNPGSTKNVTEHIVLMSTNRGLTRPLAEPNSTSASLRDSKKKQKVQSHDVSGQRTKYFGDDDKYSLKQLFEREKLSTAEDQNAMFSRLAGRGVEKSTEDYDVDDIFINRANKKINEAKIDSQERLRAINEYKRSAEAIEQCRYCFEGRNMLKHLIVAIGMNVYLCLPPVQSLVEGHCLIVPIKHVTGSTYVDEEVWDEVQIFRKGLWKMFEDLNFDVIFFEVCMDAKRFPHMTIHCIPLPKDIGHLAPMYFKKAIMESETEWAHNKKLVDLSSKDVRRAIPKGLPYFFVNFGLHDGGFGHVIEDERLFPRNFAQEIIGGMLDLDANMWRRPPRENFDEQRKKVLKFSEWWKPYDWTQRLKNQD